MKRLGMRLAFFLILVCSLSMPLLAAAQVQVVGSVGSDVQTPLPTAPTVATPPPAATTDPANDGRLVQCKGAADCNLCAFVKLIQKTINYMIALAIPLSAGLFAYAGWLYMTAFGDPGKAAKAKKIFTTVLIGFLIAISGWLLVETLLKNVLAVDYYQGWNKIVCTGERPMNATIGDLFSFLPAVKKFTPPPVCGGQPACKDEKSGKYSLAYGFKCPADKPTFDESTGVCSGSGGSGPPIAAEDGSDKCPKGQSLDQGLNACYSPDTNKYSYPTGHECPKPDYPNWDWDNGKCFGPGGTAKPVPISGGPSGGQFGYQAGIDRQAGDASSPLNIVLSCMSGKLSQNATKISSISDSLISSGQRTWAQCRSGGCAHGANSCHYGGRTCGDSSYAVDLANIQDKAALIKAAEDCGAVTNDEGNHVHVSVGNANQCGCDAGLE